MGAVESLKEIAVKDAAGASGWLDHGVSSTRLTAMEIADFMAVSCAESCSCNVAMCCLST